MDLKTNLLGVFKTRIISRLY